MAFRQNSENAHTDFIYQISFESFRVGRSVTVSEVAKTGWHRLGRHVDKWTWTNGLRDTGGSDLNDISICDTGQIVSFLLSSFLLLHIVPSSN